MNTELLTNLSNTLLVENELERELKNIFVNHCSDYDTLESINEAYYNREFECEAGCIGELLTYADTTDFFKKHSVEILEAVQDYQEETEITVELNPNSLVWLVWELKVSDWVHEIQTIIELGWDF